MDLLKDILEKFSEESFSNQVRTAVALLAVPGGLWGAYLFFRWMRGQGIHSDIQQIKAQNRDMQEVLQELQKKIELLTAGSEVSVTTDLKRRFSVESSAKVILPEAGRLVRLERRAFLCYAYEDREWVAPIMEYLTRTDKIKVSINYDLQRAGEIIDRVRNEIDASDTFILLWSDAAASSRFVADEINYALPRIRSGDLKLVPIAIERPMPRPPEELKDFHFANLGN